MLTLLDPTATFTHTVDGDVDDPTIFRLRALTAREKIRVMSNPDQSGSLGATGMEYAVRFGLLGWENGSRPFQENDQLANIDSLPDAVFAELAAEVLKKSGLLGEAKKK